MEVTVFWLALTFGVHIVMVNLGIFLSLFVPYLKWRADREGDAGLDAVAYRLMRFYAATYAVAGVFGTAYTVFLLSFYPDFIGLAGHLTLIPFGISILAITVHFFSIAAFYYGWGRWSPRVHHLAGLALAASVLLIPLGFRAVFAFLNVPVGLRLAPDGRVYLDVSEALSNPTLAPLYLKSIVAAVTAGALATAGWLYYTASRGGRGAAAEARVASMLAPVAAVGLALMLPLGLWYALSLREAPYKFNSIFAGLGWRVEGSLEPELSLSWLFTVKMALYAFQVYAVAATYRHVRSGSLDAGRARLLLAAGLAGLATILAGEYLNAFSQYPYFVACMGSTGGCPQLEGLPPEALERLSAALNLKLYNELATVGPVTALTAAFMSILGVVAVYFFYAVFVKPERA